MIRHIATFLCATLIIIQTGTGFSQNQKQEVFSGPYLGQDPPGNVPVLFAPDIVSSADHIEMGIVVALDPTEIYFCRQINENGNDRWAIFVTREVENEWTEPVIASFATEYNNAEPCISADGNTIIFYRLNRSDAAFQEGTWISERVGDEWSEPSFFHEGYVMNSHDFETFYLTTGENPDKDLGQVTYDSGLFSQVSPVPGNLNTSYWEGHGQISPDGSYIVFNSVRPDNFGHADLFVSFKGSDGYWSEGINLGEDLNSLGLVAPFISRDGNYIFFQKDSDIYWVSAQIIESLRPDTVGEK